uniref:hypothetical protein n=6 Tax=Mycobacterium avium TaxID=1764 RepID=UPI001F465378
GGLLGRRSRGDAVGVDTMEGRAVIPFGVQAVRVELPEAECDHFFDLIHGLTDEMTEDRGIQHRQNGALVVRANFVLGIDFWYPDIRGKAFLGKVGVPVARMRVPSAQSWPRPR